jgi:tRNA A-37 threonylcarbamoyl transferase component Bud32
MNLSNSQLSASDRTRLEEFLLEFDQNWTEHHLGIIAGQLDAESPEFKAAALVELVKIDLDYRYREVQPTRIEWYLKRFPELRASPDTVGELLQVEIEVWLIAGQPPNIADLTERFPTLQSRFTVILEKAEQAKVRSLARRAKRIAEGRDTDKQSAGSTASMALATQETLPPTSQKQTTPGDEKGDRLGDQFGRYQLLQELGRGAMGTVYLAEDTELRRRVALKRPRIGENEAAAMLQRFYREAYAAATLNHPNICPVYDIGEHDGVPYITMAYVEGKTLSRVIRDSRALNPRAVALLVRKIALALAEAHDKGVIHRDLKPGNIMLNHRSEPIVMDFGLARQVEHADDRLSVDGMLIGTPGYMSPEQVDGDLEKVGRASDIYSLGVVLFELLTGRLPFQGSVAAVIGKILRDEAPAPSSLRAGLPDDLDAICLKMMAKSPSDRYTTMTEVAEALSSLSKKLGGETTTAAAPPPVDSTTTAQLAAQRQQISQMIDNGQWREASLQLQRMSESEGALAVPYVQWAREQTAALHVRWQEEQVVAAQSLAVAKSEFARHDYAGAAQRLVKIDKQLLTVESQQLLDESFKLAEEVDLLIHLIEQGLSGGSQAGMFRNMQRLLQLKPRDPLVRDLYRKFRWQQRLGWIGSTLADAFAMSGISRMRTTIEDPMYRKWLGSAAVVFLISFGLMSWYVTAYLRSGSQVELAEPTNATTSDAQADNGQSLPAAIEEPALLPLGTGRTPLPDGPSGLVATLTQHTDKIQGLVVSPDGRYLISTDFSGTELIWDLESRDVVGSFEMTSIMYSLLIVNDGIEVVSGGVNGLLERHSLHTQKKLMSYRGYPDRSAGGSRSIGSLQAMPESNEFVTCNFSGDVAVWNVDSELPVEEFSVDTDYKFIYPVRERFLLSGWGCPIRLVSSEGSFVRDFNDSSGGPLAVSPDGTAFVRRDLKRKMMLEVLIDTGDSPRSYQCSDRPVWSEFTRDGRHLICENANNEMQVWNRESGLMIHSETLPLMADKRAFSPDGRFLFLGAEAPFTKQPDTNEIYIWRLPMEVWPKLASDAASVVLDDKPDADMPPTVTASRPSIDAEKVPATVPIPVPISAKTGAQATAATATKVAVSPPRVAAPKKHIFIKTANEGGHSWHYSLAPPPTRWQVQEGEDTWPASLSGFGTPGHWGVTVRTEWIHPNIYLRTKVYVPRFEGRKMVLRCAHDDWAEVYVNGTLLKRFEGCSGYFEYTLVGDQIYLFRQNALNDVAVRCHQNKASLKRMDHKNPQVIDVGFRLE